MNVLTPAYGPQLRETLSESTLFDSITKGTVVIADAMQGEAAYVEEEEDDELEDELEDELKTLAAAHD